ncbi:MAG TPA: hypothetical protein VN420_00270 [Candidatus Fimivivens sp.]|nr:hypothetical protein [Candidatus Fimivivens sp.]
MNELSATASLIKHIFGLSVVCLFLGAAQSGALKLATAAKLRSSLKELQTKERLIPEAFR